MVQKIAKIPGSASEVEEAEWWFNQRDVLTEQAETAMRHGQLLRQPGNPIGPKTITLELPYQDPNRARNQAAKKRHPLRNLFVPAFSMTLLHMKKRNRRLDSKHEYK